MPTYSSVDDVLNRLREVWGSDDEALGACMYVVEFLREGGTKSRYITFYDLFGPKKGFKPDAMRKAMACLTGDDVPLLFLRFQLIEDDEDEETYDRDVYTPIDVRNFEHNGRLINPKTGEEDARLNEKLYMFFEPTPLAIELFTGRR